jgi:hypothetical protein
MTSKRFLLIIFLLLYTFISTKAQTEEPKGTFGVKSNDVFRIASPAPASIIKSGDLYVCVLVAPNVKVQTSTVKIFLDNRIITNFVKIQNDKITMIYLLPLRPGKHDLRLEAKEQGYDWLKPQEWSFFIEEKLDSISDSIQKAVKQQVELTGNVSYDHRQTYLTGSDYALSFRQEPAYTAQLNINATLRIGNVRLPFRMFRTSDEKTYNIPGAQSRNYYNGGIIYKKFEANYGDITPSFDKLVMTGTRLRGARVALNLKYFQMQVVYGMVNKALEGEEKPYSLRDGFPPGNIYIDSAKKDTVYKKFGIYKRDLAAVRFSFGAKNEGNNFGITILKSRDNINSIKVGEKPKENFVFGLDQAFFTNEIRLKVNTGIAFSLFTNDISTGPISKDQFDSAQRRQGSFDPMKYKNIQTLNFTSTKPGTSAMSSYITIQIKPKNNILTFDFRHSAVGYQSFGNPFTKVDLRSAFLGDQLYMFKRKINFNVKYTYLDNNRSGTAYATLRQHLVNSSLNIMPGIKWPQLMFMYNIQSRKTFIPTPSEESSKFKTLQANDLLTTLSSNFYYSFNAFKCNHTFNAQYVLTERKDILFYQNSNKIYLYSAGIRENITPINLTLDFQYSRTDINDNKAVKTPLTESYDTKIKYTYKKIKTSIQLGWQQSKMLYKLFSEQTSRNSYSGSVSNQSAKGLTISLEYGLSPNHSIINPDLNYEESYIMARVNYDLGIWLRK